MELSTHTHATPAANEQRAALPDFVPWLLSSLSLNRSFALRLRFHDASSKLQGMVGGIIDWWRRRREERTAARMFERHVVVFDETGISSLYPDGSMQAISWPQV